MPDDSISPGLALAWGGDEEHRRGPKREFTLDQVIAAAVGLADALGLNGVSMAAVAGSLNLSTMSVYHYVSSKDALILLMEDAAIGPPPPDEPSASWRQGLARWSAGLLDMFALHPWLLDVPLEPLPTTPNHLGWIESALRMLRDTPLQPRERLAVVLLVHGHTRWLGTLARSLQQSRVDESAGAAAIISAVTTREQFPEVFAALERDGQSPAPVPIGFGLERLLDGVERFLQRPAH